MMPRADSVSEGVAPRSRVQVQIPMEWQAIVVALLALVALALCITGWLSLDVVGAGIVVFVVTTGVLELDAALGGFGNPAVVSLASLYVLGEALSRTGALQFVATSIVRRAGGSEFRLLLWLCATAAGVSSIVSDTVVVLVFTPLAIGIARDRGIPLSRLLLPIAYASLLGGTLTLVGSSINLLTSGAAAGVGAPPLGFLAMTPVALPLVLAGLPLMIVLTRRFLPDRQSLTGMLAASDTREFVTELEVTDDSPLVGQALAGAFGSGPQPLLVTRDDDVVWASDHAHVIAPGDVVLLQGRAGQLADLRERFGLGADGHGGVHDRDLGYFELAIAPHSKAVGERVRDLKLFRDHGVVVVAILRGGRHLRERVSRLPLRAGDVLLVSGSDEARQRLRAADDVYLLDESPVASQPRRLGRRALWILAGVIALFVLGPVLGWAKAFPIPLVAMLGAIAMVAAGCLTARQAYAAIDWQILVFVVGALALGRAMESTGIVRTCAEGVVDLLAGYGPVAVLGGLVVVGTVLNQFTSPYAVTLLLTPIAIEAARQLGVANVEPFVMAVAFSGSNAFATPMGHQVNLMVMAPGGYRFGDYLRVGLPMSLFMALFTTLGLALLGGL